MRRYATLFFFSFIATSCFTQSECESTWLDTASVLKNNYRQSSTDNLARLIFNDTWSDPVFNGDGTSTLFDLGIARGFWVTGMDPSGTVKVAASSYNDSDYALGPIWAGTVDESIVCNFFRRVWTVSGDEIRQVQADFLDGTLEVDNIPKDILEWPAKGNPHIEALAIEEDLAPFFDYKRNGIYDPLDGDLPLPVVNTNDFIPHQLRFYVINDRGAHTLSRGIPLDLELQVTEFVTNPTEPSEVATTVFSRVKYVNKGSEDLIDFRIGIWDDTDLGCFTNDFMGTNRSSSSTFIYNRSGVDDDNGCAVSISDSINTIRSLVFFNCDLQTSMYYFNCGVVDASPNQCDPQTAMDYHRYLNGQWRDGTPLTFGGDGLNPGSTDTTAFAFTSLPNDPLGWSMQDVFGFRDIRTVSSTGLDTLAAGESGMLDFADHLLISESTGLDIFDNYHDIIWDLKKDYTFDILGFVTSTEDDNSKDRPLFGIRPNPADAYLDVTFNQPLEGELIVHTIEGLFVEAISVAGQPTLRLGLGDYARGTYVMTLVSESSLYTQKFLKLK